MEVDEFANKMATLKNYVRDITLTLILTFDEAFINTNLEQLFNSTLADGTQIKETYSIYTQKLNSTRKFEFLGQSKSKIARQPYFLLDSGKFYNSFEIVEKNKNIDIKANTKKETRDLKELGDILGLTQENADDLTEKLLIDEITRQLNLYL